jgi:MFS family permease
VTARNHYLVTGFVWGALFAMMTTAFMVYQVEMAGLGPLQLVLVGTALEIGAFLFEIPTGVVADAWSRKGSVVVGFLIIGVAFVISGLNPRFEIIALSSFGWGIGWTFISGAKEAWLADEVGVEVSAGLMLKGAGLAVWVRLSASCSRSLSAVSKSTIRWSCPGCCSRFGVSSA